MEFLVVCIAGKGGSASRGRRGLIQRGLHSGGRGLHPGGGGFASGRVG